MKTRVASLTAVLLLMASGAGAQVLDLWPNGKVAFGVYAPSEAPRGSPPVYSAEGAAKVAANPLYDFVFLNLEGAYDPAAVKAYGRGLKKARRKTLIVRIPPISKDGADATRTRVKIRR